MEKNTDERKDGAGNKSMEREVDKEVEGMTAV